MNACRRGRKSGRDMPTKPALMGGGYSPPWRSLSPDRLKTLPAVTTLPQIWSQQFEPLEQGGGWLAEPVLAAPERINSPLRSGCAHGRETRHVLGGIQSPLHPNL